MIASLTTWGPAARLWLARQTEAGGYGAYAFQETHIVPRDLEKTERELVNMGFKACFTAARTSTRSEQGSYGCTAVVMRGRQKASSYRAQANEGTHAKATTRK